MEFSAVISGGPIEAISRFVTDLYTGHEFSAVISGGPIEASGGGSP